VFEAKDRRLSRNAALAELDAMPRDARRRVRRRSWPSDDELPARTHANTEFNANKVFCVYDPEEGSTLSLEVAYTLARARVLMARDDADGLDAVALRTEVERAIQALEEVRKIKVQLTNASTGIENARGLVDTMADTSAPTSRRSTRCSTPRSPRRRSAGRPPRRGPRARAGRLLPRHRPPRRAAARRRRLGVEPPDGTVEVWLEGEPDAVDSMLRVLHDGPPRAEVERVDVDDVEPRGVTRLRDPLAPLRDCPPFASAVQSGLKALFTRTVGCRRVRERDDVVRVAGVVAAGGREDRAAVRAEVVADDARRSGGRRA
jgi:hypothetical protein